MKHIDGALGMVEFSNPEMRTFWAKSVHPQRNGSAQWTCMGDKFVCQILPDIGLEYVRETSCCLNIVMHPVIIKTLKKHFVTLSCDYGEEGVFKLMATYDRLSHWYAISHAAEQVKNG